MESLVRLRDLVSAEITSIKLPDTLGSARANALAVVTLLK